LEDILHIQVLGMDFRFIPIFMVVEDGIILTTIIHTEIIISDKTPLITLEEEMQYLPIEMAADQTLEMR
jgi:hypothetical protein